MGLNPPSQQTALLMSLPVMNHPQSHQVVESAPSAGVGVDYNIKEESLVILNRRSCLIKEIAI